MPNEALESIRRKLDDLEKPESEAVRAIAAAVVAQLRREAQREARDRMLDRLLASAQASSPGSPPGYRAPAGGEEERSDEVVAVLPGQTALVPRSAPPRASLLALLAALAGAAGHYLPQLLELLRHLS